MIGPAVQDLDAELEQPYAEPGPALPRMRRPRACRCRRRRPPAGRSGGTSRSSRPCTVPPCSLAQASRHERIARMVVHDGQRMAAAAVGQRDPALEVHLPQQVGGLLLEALVGRQRRRPAATIRPCRRRISCTVETRRQRHARRARGSARSCARPRPDARRAPPARAPRSRPRCAPGSHAAAANDPQARHRPPAQRSSHL